MTDKTEWGEGPWQDEPDEEAWTDESTGLACIARRTDHLGNWCGYVAVPDDHPLHGKYYDDVRAEVHGGLTWSGPLRADDPWLFGFDCAHHRDFCPALAARERKHGWPPIGNGTYRTLDYVRAEVTSLAKQIAEVKP